jgi:hypothetical protein
LLHIAAIASKVPYFPALLDTNYGTAPGTLLFGANAICRYLAAVAAASPPSYGEAIATDTLTGDLLEIEELALSPLLRGE